MTDGANMTNRTKGALAIGALFLGAGLLYKLRKPKGEVVPKPDIVASTGDGKTVRFAHVFADKETSAKAVGDIRLQEDSFVELLTEFIRLAEHTQNNPPKCVPREELIAEAITAYLAPYVQPRGPLILKKFTYTSGRPSVLVSYPCEGTDKVVSFVGSHMDVVPANPSEWKRPPFQLVQEGDRLYGRGVTDCLGHVALFCNFFRQLAQLKPDLNATVAAIFIADEEHGGEGIGIDVMEEKGELEFLRHGPLFWVDSANFGPTLGTGGMSTWKLTVTGQKGHSGMPHLAINPINLATQALGYIQRRFYEEFPMTEKEEQYKFNVGSSLKPTRITSPAGSINQIPQTCTIQGDIRFTPFIPLKRIRSTVEAIVAELSDVSKMQTTGYEVFQLEGIKGQLEWEWLPGAMTGVAVDLESPGYQALLEAIEAARGQATPFSLTGSLPIIADLKASGFDVQVTGFGRMEAYHALDEYGLLSEFVQGSHIVAHILNKLAT